ELSGQLPERRHRGPLHPVAARGVLLAAHRAGRDHRPGDARLQPTAEAGPGVEGATRDVELNTGGIVSHAVLEAERPLAFAHRGGARLFPENTLAAFEGAFELGCTTIELDLRLTRDGKLVVLHDPTVDRTTNGRGP